MTQGQEDNLLIVDGHRQLHRVSVGAGEAELQLSYVARNLQHNRLGLPGEVVGLDQRHELFPAPAVELVLVDLHVELGQGHGVIDVESEINRRLPDLFVSVEEGGLFFGLDDVRGGIAILNVDLVAARAVHNTVGGILVGSLNLQYEMPALQTLLLDDLFGYVEGDDAYRLLGPSVPAVVYLCQQRMYLALVDLDSDAHILGFVQFYAVFLGQAYSQILLDDLILVQRRYIVGRLQINLQFQLVLVLGLNDQVQLALAAFPAHVLLLPRQHTLDPELSEILCTRGCFFVPLVRHWNVLGVAAGVGFRALVQLDDGEPFQPVEFDGETLVGVQGENFTLQLVLLPADDDCGACLDCADCGRGVAGSEVNFGLLFRHHDQVQILHVFPLGLRGYFLTNQSNIFNIHCIYTLTKADQCLQLILFLVIGLQLLPETRILGQKHRRSFTTHNNVHTGISLNQLHFNHYNPTMTSLLDDLDRACRRGGYLMGPASVVALQVDDRWLQH